MWYFCFAWQQRTSCDERAITGPEYLVAFNLPDAHVPNMTQGSGIRGMAGGIICSVAKGAKQPRLECTFAVDAAEQPLMVVVRHDGAMGGQRAMRPRRLDVKAQMFRAVA